MNNDEGSAGTKTRTLLPPFWVILLGMLCGCGGLPHTLFYAYYGRMPLGGDQKPFAVPLGSTRDETRSALGAPHDRMVRDDDGTEIWYYHGDILGFGIYSMKFDAEGRLGNAWW